MEIIKLLMVKIGSVVVVTGITQHQHLRNVNLGPGVAGAAAAQAAMGEHKQEQEHAVLIRVTQAVNAAFTAKLIDNHKAAIPKPAMCAATEIVKVRKPAGTVLIILN